MKHLDQVLFIYLDIHLSNIYTYRVNIDNSISIHVHEKSYNAYFICIVNDEPGSGVYQWWGLENDPPTVARSGVERSGYKMGVVDFR